MKPNQKLWKSAVIGLMLATAASASDHGARSNIVEPGQVLLGKSYNGLVGEWANWLNVEPMATNPAFDPDGRFCDRNQQGKVWFLAGTFEGVADRTCQVPAGKAIFLSLGGVFLSFWPDFPAAGDRCRQQATALEKVRCDVNHGVPGAPDISLKATLDGAPVGDLFAFRVQSDPGGFTLRVPESSLLTDLGFAAGDRSPAVADGYFLLLKPLQPGQHTLSVRMVNPDKTVTGVNYTLIIQGGTGE